MRRAGHGFALCLAAVGLAGCVPWIPTALSAAAGALTITKDVLDIDISLSQDKPDKVPLSKVFLP